MRMIAGLPWTAWLLLFLSAGLGLTIVIVFYFTQRRHSKSATVETDRND